MYTCIYPPSNLRSQNYTRTILSEGRLVHTFLTPRKTDIPKLKNLDSPIHRKISESMPFPVPLALNVLQKAWSWIWIWSTVSLSYNGNLRPIWLSFIKRVRRHIIIIIIIICKFLTPVLAGGLLLGSAEQHISKSLRFF